MPPQGESDELRDALLAIQAKAYVDDDEQAHDTMGLIERLDFIYSSAGEWAGRIGNAPAGKGGRDMDIEWRVSFTMWLHGEPHARGVQRVTDREADAREQYEGLVSMVAPHELRPCDTHIWNPKLERAVVTREWTLVSVGFVEEERSDG